MIVVIESRRSVRISKRRADQVPARREVTRPHEEVGVVVAFGTQRNLDTIKKKNAHVDININSDMCIYIYII